MFDLEALGFRSFQKQQPALHTDIIMAVWSTTAGDRFGSIRSIDFIRGWYSTWIKGPETMGCGMHAEAVLSLFPNADREWSYEVVLIHDQCYSTGGEETPGVLPEIVFENSKAYWIPSTDLIGQLPACDALELSRGNCKTKLRHAGIFYPRRGA
jgi:hypothetical protein